MERTYTTFIFLSFFFSNISLLYGCGKTCSFADVENAQLELQAAIRLFTLISHLLYIMYCIKVFFYFFNWHVRHTARAVFACNARGIHSELLLKQKISNLIKIVKFDYAHFFLFCLSASYCGTVEGVELFLR